MMELSKQVAEHLDANGFGTFDETGVSGNIFINTIPDQPHEAVAIFTTGGPGSDPKNTYGRSNIQVLIRTIPNDPRGGETKATGIIRSLNGFNSDYLTPGGNYVVDVTAIQSGPSQIGQDQNGRFEYSQNFTIEYSI
jgi:Bacteriophage minor capsid protein